jgi:hypothetical protein
LKDSELKLREGMESEAKEISEIAKERIKLIAELHKC